MRQAGHQTQTTNHKLIYLCAVKKNKQPIVLEKVLVEDHAGEGRSLARVEGKVIFIEDAVPGDVVDIRLSRNKKDWAEGRPIHFHSYSPDRVEPFCEHFGVCGGCQWQMLPYEKQLFYKQRQVEEVLGRIGKIELPAILPIIGASSNRYYRNKMEYTFATKRFIPFAEYEKKIDKEILATGVIFPGAEAEAGAAGFHARGFFEKVVDIKTCHLQAEPTNAIRLAVKNFVQQEGWSFYDIRQHTGFIRTMQLRICRTGEIMVNVVLGFEDEIKRKKLLDHLVKNFPQVTTLLYTINTKMNDSLYDLEPQVYTGKGFVTETMEDFKFKIGPKSFFQTNTAQGEALYKVTREFAGLTGKETVYDLYCGTGSIGIFLSRQAKKIIGVETIKEAIDDAKENALLNHLSHLSFFDGDVIDICTESFFRQHGKPDVIITDPPRAGMHEKLVLKMLEMKAPRIVYVSCNPATQARDLNLLGGQYRVTKIQPVDMFPHTRHIENVVQLTLKK